MTAHDSKEFEAEMRTLGLDEDTLAETLSARSGGTLFMPLEGEVEEPLPVLLGERSDLEMKQPIGRGGMGLVQLAHQRAMAREVAVKRVLPERKGAGRELLVEARVMGNLEHPNVVPVYSLGTDVDGEILFVMKRIEGKAWSQHLAAKPQTGVELEREVRTLIEVCHAVHYAHERGVLHRDIKPSNVMLGNFGEVYLLDWGLSVGFGDRAPRGVPLASEVAVVTGTPGYMAPEMVSPDGRLSRRTDVYLLGAVLFEIATGVPPHANDDTFASLHASWAAKPPKFDDAVDGELAAIATRALARDPDGRHQSADDLANELELFLSHASARVMASAASERLDALQVLPHDEDSDAAAQRLFDQARFGFEQALELFADSRVAKTGARQAAITMCRRELARNNPLNAQRLVALLDDAPPDLTLEVEAAVQTDKEERERQERLKHNLDIEAGATARSLVILGSGVVWAAFLVGLFIYFDGDVPFSAFALPSLIGWTLGAAVLVLGRRWSMPNVSGILKSSIVLHTIAAASVAWVVIWSTTEDLTVALLIAHLGMFVSGGAMAGMDRRLAGHNVIQMAAAISIALFPEYALLLSGILGGAAFASVTIARHIWPRESLVAFQVRDGS